MRIPQNQNRIGLYLHVSSEEQAEREMIQAQRQALAHWAQLHRVNVIQEYADNGVSGTLPLSMRPQGKLLLEAAKQRRFDAVVVYSVDRLVRSISVLMEVYAELSEWGVDIKSATEPFDTSTPFGRFLFQFLGSMAEFQRSAILERLVMGRDRIVLEGKSTHRPVPL